MKTNYIIDTLIAPGGEIPIVSTKLSVKDYWQTILVRWNFGRNNYKISPGLYVVGSPNENSDVFVTANYKLSFDHLRKNLDGLNAWILVLDTKGVNVWCAAGKGTFSTKELINRMSEVNISNFINHKRLILPQLGATGVSAYKVKDETGFNVIYGPVRAEDIKPFIQAGYKANEEMRTITFELKNRIKQIPVDLVYNAKKYLLISLAIILVISGINKAGISFQLLVNSGLPGISNIILGFLAGIVLTPILLPLLPGRAFAFKGFETGILVFLLAFLLKTTGSTIIENTSWFCMIVAISSFIAMNFTGSSTFTSLSGVKKEMKFAIPVQVSLASVGLVALIISKFLF